MLQLADLDGFVFKSMTDYKNIDLIPYLRDYLINNKIESIMVGTDSQNRRGWTNFVTTVVLHTPNKGGHIVFARKGVKRITDKFSRLWMEVQISVDLANLLKENNINIDYLDLDYNKDPKFESNKILQAALGYCTGFGYTPRSKPNSISTICSDFLVKK